MGIWVTAFCQTSVTEAVKHLDTFLDTIDPCELEIRIGGLTAFDPQAFSDALACERITQQLPPPFDTACFAVVFGPSDRDCTSWDRYTDPTHIKQTADAAIADIPASMSTSTKHSLSRTLNSVSEIVCTKLPDSSLDAVHFPLALDVAMFLALHTSGVVAANGKLFNPMNKQAFQ